MRYRADEMTGQEDKNDIRADHRIYCRDLFWNIHDSDIDSRER